MASDVSWSINSTALDVDRYFHERVSPSWQVCLVTGVCIHVSILFFWRALTAGIVVLEKNVSSSHIDTMRERSSRGAILGTWVLWSLQLDRQPQATSPLPARTTQILIEMALYLDVAVGLQNGTRPACYNPIRTHSEPLTHCHILRGWGKFIS